MPDATQVPRPDDDPRQDDSTLPPYTSSDAWLATLVDSSFDAIISITVAGVVVSWNASAERLFGYTAAEIIGSSISLLYTPERSSDLASLLAQFQRGERIHWFETERRTKAGAARPVSITYSPITDAQGRIIGVSAIVRDNSERKRMEDQIRFQAQLLKMVDQALIATDMEGRILYWNRFAEELYGWEAEEVVGRPIVEILANDTTESEAFTVMSALQRGEHWSGEFQVRRRDGTTFLAEVTDSPIRDEHDQLIGMVGISHDISARKRLEQELEQRVAERTVQWQTASDELRRLAAHLLRAREDERASIARDLHDDLGQVVTAVKYELASIALMLTNQPQGFRATVPGAIQKLDAIQKLLDDSLQSIRTMIKQLRPEFMEEIGLPAVLAWQAEQFEAHTGIHCRVTAEVKEVAGDPYRALALFRIVQESLTNVGRHAQATRVDISLRQTDDQLFLEVRDNGRGIGASELQKHDHFGVMGMRERVIAFDGEFKISGSPGQGTTVWVRMPMV